MTCTETRDLLSDYIDDDLAAGARSHVEAHLAGCEGCRSRQRALRRTVRFVQTHASALPDVTRPGATYARFTRAIVDEAYERTPEEVLVEALGSSAPGLREGVPERAPGQERAS
ncbi:MAG TPA: zf-HC2 domain-containing protein [Dehalococcoidia bacterium]|nr:zf-HC2 domain-containing protein [Dehalococcoidia bacterium]